MDKGAHFFRCDFQVHTPRDPGWDGSRAATEDERKTYADELIAACRTKGLEAIAISDHHDIEFFSYIKDAAAGELDGNGDSLPAEGRIIVFPAMELTLGVPCQAIVIFDADFPPALLKPIPVLLAVDQSQDTFKQHSPTKRLDHITSLDGVYELLNQQEHIRNRFIVLPNVSDRGRSTVLRTGFAPHYKKMPCVGGYLDGAISQLGTGNLGIVNGTNREYGNKKIGIFQTSDNRKRNHADLGVHTTWVKWATPTAEALRQACLARESRLSQVEPSLPSVRIISLDVTNSKFMGPFNIEFNPQFNAIIGGRGTGKSTILEYLRWGLFDQPPTELDDEQDADFQFKRRNLIEKTLTNMETIVQVSFLVNTIPHTVRRNAVTKEITLKIGNGNFERCKEADIRNLLPIQAYSQKQLSNVGVRLEELKRFLTSPIKQKLNEFSFRTQNLASQIRNSYELVQRKRVIEKELLESQLELKSLGEQITTLRKNLKGISEEDQRIISLRDSYEKEERILEGWAQELASARETIATAKESLGQYPSSISEIEELPNKNLISEAERKIKNLFEGIKKSLFEIEKTIDPAGTMLQDYDLPIQKWLDLKNAFNEKYEEAKARSTSQENQITQIQTIEERNKVINSSLLGKKQTLIKIGKPEEAYEVAKKEWVAIYQERGEIMNAECENLTLLSDQAIKVTLKKGAGTKKLEELLKEVFSGGNIRTEKVESLCGTIRQADEPVQEWGHFLDELEVLALYSSSQETSAPLPETPKLSNLFGLQERRRMAEKLTPEKWLDLALVELEDIPEFQYQSREGQYIDFSDASAGQQATALMQLLLNQEGPPLIVDQPEDDLDNQVISRIVEQIWEAKKKRQLIFSSHNANIVVNGDAELVVCCDYRVAGDQSGGKIKAEGAIDIEAINKEITIVMEGGKDAFKLRKEKYGF